MSDIIQERDVERVDEAMKVLGEHFDSVGIFVTRHEGSAGGTIRAYKTQGNFFATMGFVQTWLTRQSECTRIDTRGEDDDE